MDWVNEYKIYVVLGFCVLLLISRFGFGAYSRWAGSGKVLVRVGLTGQADRPWLSMLGGVAMLFMGAYILVYIVYPDIQNFYLPIRAIQDTRISLMGMIVTILGSVAMLISQFQLVSMTQQRILQGRSLLITDGLYAISRNPFYLGLYTALFGIFLMLPNWLFLLASLIYMVNIHFNRILPEEVYLENRDADAYRRYRNQVNRYF
jgi:protein-S-isoprenylcysteine O-methyltransferase Ste14